MRETTVNVRTHDGKSHDVTVLQTDNGRWAASGYADGHRVAVAGEHSAQQAIERWTVAYEHRFED